MLIVRSVLFNLAWYANLLIQMLVQAPLYPFLSRDRAEDVCNRWCFSNDPLQRALAGTDIEFQGLENRPDGPCIIACKHQSIWEFYAVHARLVRPAYVLKAELMKIPVFGWFVAKVDHIPIRRGERSKALKAMLREAKDRVDDGRSVIIFPEGTRKAPGAPADYRYGVVRLYQELDIPVLPVALVSGLFWPRRKFLRHPGLLRVRMMPVIEPGMAADAFQERLHDLIEWNTEDLYLETSLDPVRPPMDGAVEAAVERARARRRERGMAVDAPAAGPIL